jgi:hypothetical protein
LTREDDPLRRSMAASPEEWLDRLVSERVIAEVQTECAALRARNPSEPSVAARRPQPDPDRSEGSKLSAVLSRWGWPVTGLHSSLFHSDT